MQTFALPMDPGGPLVDILVGLNASVAQTLRIAGQPVPNPLGIRALIDTGAEQSCVDPSALAHLVAVGLQPLGFLYANIPAGGGMRMVSEYAVSLTILHPKGNVRANLVLRNCPVLEQPLGPLGYQALLGRDVLSRCLLVYDGPSESFTLAY